MRLFVAVEVDETMLRAAREAADDVRTRLGGVLRPRWVAPENMHLTVRFIGHVHDDRVAAVSEALQRPLSIAPFDVALSHCGAFPPQGPPRVLWIGLREGLPSLRDMHDEFDRRLLPLGFEPEDRPFSAHLTLARVKDAPRGCGATVREALAAVRVAPATCRVSEATVFESRLSPKGSTYLARFRIPLLP